MQSSFDTTLIHAGTTTDPHTGAVNTPIFQTSTYAQDELGKHKGYEYSRTKNPTRDGIESLIAECEGGKYGFAFASGRAALGTILSLFKSGDCLIISQNVYGGTFRILDKVFKNFGIIYKIVDTRDLLGTILSLFKSGDCLIISQNVYGGTFRILDKVFKNFGIIYKIVDTRDLDALNAAITPEVKAVLIESPANPLLSVTPLAKVAEICRQKGVLSIVDNTFMTPYLQQPLKLGIDIVVHSATKYLGGHSDLVAGLVVVDDESLAERIGFLQNSIGGVLAPFDSVVHSATKYLGGHSDLVAGLVVVDDESLAERIGFLQNSIGGVLAPFDSFLLIRGMKTLGLRMQRHCENALFLAEALSEHKAVEKVYYPGLKSDSEYEVQSSQARGGGGMLSFILKPEYDYRIFFKSTRIIVLAESLGGVESLLCHPASMTHASIPKDLRESMGIAENLIRLSVGIEYSKDLLEDIHQAIEKVESLLCHPASMTHASIPKDLRESMGIAENLIRLSVGIEYSKDLLEDIHQAIEKAKLK